MARSWPPRFRACVPPKYKRERRREPRLAALRYLHDLLSSPTLALRYSIPEPAAPDCYPRRWDALCDQYDACLAALPGLLLARGSPYICLAGPKGGGQVLLLADAWLRESLGQWAPVASAGVGDTVG